MEEQKRGGGMWKKVLGAIAVLWILGFVFMLSSDFESETAETVASTAGNIEAATASRTPAVVEDRIADGVGQVDVPEPQRSGADSGTEKTSSLPRERPVLPQARPVANPQSDPDGTEAEEYLPAFYDAIAEDDHQKVKQMLEAYPSLARASYRDDQIFGIPDHKMNCSPLDIATKWSTTEMMEMITVAGTDVNRPSESGDRPLHWAAQRGPDKVALLLAYGADVDAKNQDGLTPLLLAKELEVMEYLLAYGANPDSQFPEDYIVTPTRKIRKGSTKLHTLPDNRQAFELFIDYGADLTVRDSDFNTALDVASKPVRTYLRMNDGELNSESREDITPHEALLGAGGDVQTLRRVLEQGVSPDIRDEYGDTLLTKLVRHDLRPEGYAEAFDVLLAHDASVTFEVVREAVQGGASHSLRRLVDSGADLEMRDDAGRTPLLLAIQSGNTEATKLLLGAGADPNAQDKQGQNALSYAANNVHDDSILGIVASAVKGGKTLDASGETPLTRMLKEDAYITEIQQIIDSGFSVNSPNGAGETPLSIAVANDNRTAVQALLKAGADPNAKVNGFGPLHLAFYNFKERPAIVEYYAGLLSRHGADSQAVDGHGRTANQLADEVGMESLKNYMQQEFQPFTPHEAGDESNSGATVNAIQRTARVTGDGVRIRSMPSTDGEILGGLDTGAEVLLLEDDGSAAPWQKIRSGDTEGWMHGDFLKVMEEGRSE